MGLGLFYVEYCDAIKEGDGLCILRCWRYLWPLFKIARRTNYTLEAFYMLYNSHFVYSPRQAEQLIWCRCVNTHGLQGRNIPMDLHMEHLNFLCKEAISALGANKTPKAICRMGVSGKTFQLFGPL